MLLRLCLLFFIPFPAKTVLCTHTYVALPSRARRPQIRIPGGFEVPQTCITSLPNGALFNASSAPAIDVPARPPPHELHEALGGRQDVDGLGHQHTVRWTRARTARCTSRTRAPAPPTTITPCSPTSAAARAKGASPLCVAFVRADRRPPLPPLLRLPPFFTAPTAPVFTAPRNINLDKHCDRTPAATSLTFTNVTVNGDPKPA